MKDTKTYTAEELDQLPEFQEPDLDDDEEFDDFDDDDEDEVEDDETEDEVPENAEHLLTFDEIVEADDTAEETVYVKEWGGSVKLKGITKTEFDYLRRQSRSKANKGRSQSIIEREVLVAGMVSPRLTIERYNLLMEKSSGVIVRLTNRILEKSGLADEAEARREQRFPRKR